MFPHDMYTQNKNFEQLTVNLPHSTMAVSLSIPQTLDELRGKADEPYRVGLACGQLLYSIAPLVAYHLDASANYQNKPQSACIDTAEFTSTIDTCIRHLRQSEGCTERFPDDHRVDRKERRPRRKYLQQFTGVLEVAFKSAVRKELADLFHPWGPEKTALFNKGVDWERRKRKPGSPRWNRYQSLIVEHKRMFGNDVTGKYYDCAYTMEILVDP